MYKLYKVSYCRFETLLRHNGRSFSGLRILMNVCITKQNLGVAKTVTWMKFGCDEIVFAQELVVVNDVELFAGGQLFATNGAHETLDMIDALTSSANQVIGKNSLTTATALGPEPPVMTMNTHTRKVKHVYINSHE
jgi:hypothetical protein